MTPMRSEGSVPEFQVGMTAVVNNGLSPQYCEVEILGIEREHDAFVRFPDGSEENVPFESLELAPEPGYKQWTGEGVWAT